MLTLSSRVRRVKCDEAKPICWRCQKARRKCQGYPIGAPPGPDSCQDPPNDSFGLGKIGKTITFGTSLEYDQDKDRWRTLACTVFAEGFLGTKTGPELAFWAQLLPQLTHCIPSVNEAAAAFGACYEHQVLRRRNDTSRFLALKQVTTTVKRLQADIVQLPCGPLPVFVACVLLACAETIQHKQIDALLHLRGAFAAMSLEQPPDAEHRKKIPWDEDTSYIFQKLDLQVATYALGMGPLLPSVNVGKLEDRETEPMTMQMADKTLFQALHAAYRFCARAAEYKYKVNAPERDFLVVEQDRNIASLNAWLAWYQKGYQSSGRWFSDADRLQGLVLQAQCLSALIYASNILDPYETAYDKYAPHFQRIVQCVEQVLDANKSPINLPTFNPEIGIIQPLYLTAVKYRHSRWRSKAIALLSRCGREGPWCNYVEAAVGEAVFRAEEGACFASARQASPTAEIKREILPENLLERDRIAGCTIVDVLECSDGSKTGVIQLAKCRDMKNLLATPDDEANWMIWQETCELAAD